jgi:hypothetical protein
VTRGEAAALVQALFAQAGQKSPGLNARGLGGISTGEVDVFFDHRDPPGTLKCSALIYRFKGPPKLKVVEAYRQAERAQLAQTGGGRFDFQPENGGMYLSRLYAEPVAPEQFVSEIGALTNAVGEWRSKVATKVAGQLSGF